MKTLAVAVITIVIVSAIQSPLRAGVQVNDLIQLANGVGAPGGIFNVDDLTNPAVPNFDTFCVELEEIIFFNTTYRVANISTVSVTGGKTLTPFTAWLYDRFLGHGGGLASFNSSNFDDVNTLQVGIWKGLGYSPLEINTSMGGLYNYYNFLLSNKPWQAAFNTQNGTTWPLNSIGSVRIMNLKTLTNINAQDQLVEIPEPISLIIWPLILACVGCGWTLRARSRG